MAIIYVKEMSKKRVIVNSPEQLLAIADGLADGLSDAIAEHFVSKQEIKNLLTKYDDAYEAPEGPDDPRPDNMDNSDFEDIGKAI